MIDTVNTATCKACGKPITIVSTGPRKREYCNNACKERAYRERKATPAQPTIDQQNIATLQEKLMRLGTEKEKVERRVQMQRTRIGELEAEGRRLRERVNELVVKLHEAEMNLARMQQTMDQLRDIEEAFRTDTRVHPLKRYLSSSPYHAVRPGCAKILDPESGFVPAGSRGMYTDIMRRAGFTVDEQADVWAAWRDMLKDELFKSYYANRNQS